jgi:hypothetical protein
MISPATMSLKPGGNRVGRWSRVKMSAMGHKPTYAAQKGMSALPPIATAKADSRKRSMSALLLKADMCAAPADVGYGPKTDTACPMLRIKRCKRVARRLAPSCRSSFLKREPQAGDGFGRGFRKATLIIICRGEPPVMLFIKRAKILSTRLYEFFEGGDIDTIVTSPDKLIQRTNQATFSDLRKSRVRQTFSEVVVHTPI